MAEAKSWISVVEAISWIPQAEAISGYQWKKLCLGYTSGESCIPQFTSWKRERRISGVRLHSVALHLLSKKHPPNALLPL